MERQAQDELCRDLKDFRFYSNHNVIPIIMFGELMMESDIFMK